MKPPKPPDLTPEAMKKAGRIMIANPILGRLSADPDALTKTQRLIDSYSQSKASKLGETLCEVWDVAMPHTDPRCDHANGR